MFKIVFFLVNSIKSNSNFRILKVKTCSFCEKCWLKKKVSNLLVKQQYSLPKAQSKLNLSSFCFDISKDFRDRMEVEVLESQKSEGYIQPRSLQKLHPEKKVSNKIQRCWQIEAFSEHPRIERIRETLRNWAF